MELFKNSNPLLEALKNGYSYSQQFFIVCHHDCIELISCGITNVLNILRLLVSAVSIKNLQQLKLVSILMGGRNIAYC